MSPLRFHRLMRRQLNILRREGLLDSATHARLLATYPVDDWDWLRLGRWFTVFGAISVAIGGGLLATNFLELTLRELAIFLALLVFGLFAGGWRLRASRLVWSRRSLELLGGLTLIGLSFTLGAIYSRGSGNWPALLLIDLLVLLPLAYALHNVLLLILCAVVFFTWFGGMTGYLSGWGAYWFTMNYPMRFLVAGVAIAGVGSLHRIAESGPLHRYRDFFKVWLSSGLFFAEMALWLMSLFGNFGSVFERYLETAEEIFLFNALWAAFNGVLLYLGGRFGLRMARAYAVTFLTIQAYTLYFWQVWGRLGIIFGTFAAGAATLALVVFLERRVRHRREQARQPAQVPGDNVEAS